MWDYFLTNISMSILALCMLYLLKDSPARLRFYLVITALLAWFVPWHLVSTITVLSESVSPLTDEVFDALYWLENAQPLNVENAANTTAKITADGHDSGYAWLNILTLAAVVFVVGGILLLKDIIHYHIHLKRWHHLSKEDQNLWQEHGFGKHNIAIRILDGYGPGMATGFIKPVIWLNKNRHNCQTTKTILTHELNHIKQHDPAWMWFLTFTCRLFWWNPLIHLLTKMAREYIELSCDEKCREQLQEQYSNDLAKVLLDSSKTPTQFVAAPLIKNGSNFNIQRVKTLTKEIKMKTKHLIIATLGFSLLAFVGTAVSSHQDRSLINSTNQNQVKKNKPTKIKIYREINEMDALHNELVDELLQITHQAKSDSPEIINQILADLDVWNVNRRTNSDYNSEHTLTIYSFTITSYLLNKVGRYAEIPATYDNLFPEAPIEKQLFLKHHVSNAYIRMGEPERAIALMADVPKRQNKTHNGTLMLIAQAHLAAGYYNEVMEIANKLMELGQGSFNKKYALNLKYAAYLAIGDTAKADEINNILQNEYSVSAQEPKLGVSGSPILAYLPEVN